MAISQSSLGTDADLGAESASVGGESSSVGAESTSRSQRRLLSYPLALTLASGYIVIAVARGVDNSWDFQHYHFAVGWSALHGHLVSRDWVPAGAMSFFNPMLDTLYVALAEVNPWLAHAVFAIPALAACFVMIHLLDAIWPAPGRRAAWLLATASILAVLTTDALGQIGGTMNDLTLTLPIVAGSALVHRSLSDTSRSARRDLLLACACWGAAAGLKVTVVPISVGLGLGAVAGVLAIQRHSEAPPTGAQLRIRHVAAGWAIGWSLTGLLWSLYLWVSFGNPAYPFLNQVFRSRWATTKTWSTPYHLSVVDIVVYPLKAAIIRGTHNVSPYDLIEPRFAVGVVGAALTLVAWRRRQHSRSPQALALAVGWLSAYLLWAVLLANARYTIPLLALSVPCFVSGLQQFRLRVGPSVAVLTGLLAVIAAVTLVTNTPEWGPRTTTPQREWEFPDGPRAVPGMALIQNWKWQDVVILSGRWPMGFITAELEPNRVWNLREFTIEGPELTRFSRYVAGTIDRDRSLVAFDPRLDDARSINRIMRRMLGTDVTFVECGVFESRWTPTQVCSVRLEAAARLSRPGLR